MTLSNKESTWTKRSTLELGLVELGLADLGLVDLGSADLGLVDLGSAELGLAAKLGLAGTM